MTRETGFFTELEEKALAESDDCWTITGYAAVFGNKDMGNDIIAPGAFAESLKTMMPVLLHEHQMDKPPIGTIIEAREDRKGLYIKAELPKDDTFVSGRIVPQIKRRGLKGMSIGYKTQDTGRDGSTRIIKKAMVFEASLVKIGMNPLAGVDTIKSASGLGLEEWKDFSDREREVHLKSLGVSDGLAKRIVRFEREAQGTKGRRDAGDNGRSQTALPDFASLIRNATARL